MKRRIKSIQRFIIATSLSLVLLLGIITTTAFAIDLFTGKEKDIPKEQNAQNNEEVIIENQQKPSTEIMTNDPIENMKIKLRNGDREGLKVVFLTFDDGPNENTGEILDVLKACEVKATFFTLKNETEIGREAYQRIIAEGHTLGNHTATHSYESYKNPEKFYKEVKELDDFQKEVTGVEPSRIFRFPGGSSNANKSCVEGITNQGYTFVDWNVAADDEGQPSKERAAENMIEGCREHNVSVLLTHAELKSGPREALTEVIQTLKAEGYTFLPMEKDFNYSNAIHIPV